MGYVFLFIYTVLVLVLLSVPVRKYLLNLTEFICLYFGLQGAWGRIIGLVNSYFDSKCKDRAIAQI
jgi:hypothetical protein